MRSETEGGKWCREGISEQRRENCSRRGSRQKRRKERREQHQDKEKKKRKESIVAGWGLRSLQIYGKAEHIEQDVGLSRL